jgi:hypothetical protein
MNKLGRYRVCLLLALVCLTASLSGCVTLSDPEVSQEYRSHTLGSIAPGQSAGQTFISRRPHLNTVTLWLKADSDDPQKKVLAELFHSPQDRQPLGQVATDFHTLQSHFPISLRFPAQNDPAGQTYYLRLSTTDGQVQVFGRDEDAYPYGQFYVNEQAQDADAAFRSGYDYDLAAMLGDLDGWLRGIWLLLPLAIVLFLPGWLLLDLLRVRRRFDLGEQAALSAGISLAVIPILLTWTSLVGLHWTRPAVWILGGVLLLAGLWRGWLSIMERRFGEPQIPRQIDWPSLALLGIFLVCLAVRLAMVRDLAAPPWVDPVHHGLVTRLILEQGRLPASYAPYIQSNTASYHPGFHSGLAMFIWLSGMELSQAMLLYGQVLNALAILAAYLFTTTLVKERSAGVIAALITGLVTPMPAYYTSWGRYTQLAGLIILPVALALILGALQEKDGGKAAYRPGQVGFGLLVLAAAASGGLFLNHYRVFAFLILLLAAIVLVRGVKALFVKKERRNWALELGLLAGVFAAAILLTIPWWPSTLSSLLVPSLAWGQAVTPLFRDFAWPFLFTALGMYATYLAAAGLVLGIVNRRAFPFILILWIFLMFGVANLAALGLPGGNLVNNLSVEISLFLPISALGGYLIGWLYNLLQRHTPAAYRWLPRAGIAVLSLGVCLLGASRIISILNPVTFLFREADRPALDWVQANVPAGAAVQINPFNWGYGVYAGQDGGYWMTPLAGRKSEPPPILYALNEVSEAVQSTSAQAQKVIELSNKPQELSSWLRGQGIEYIFIGARGGVLSPRGLRESGLFQQVYGQRGAYVFRLLPESP